MNWSLRAALPPAFELSGMPITGFMLLASTDAWAESADHCEFPAHRSTDWFWSTYTVKNSGRAWSVAEKLSYLLSNRAWRPASLLSGLPM